ncbi:MAG: hypothetical protein ACREXT_08425 [Gammaproteobacteria bacterium]
MRRIVHCCPVGSGTSVIMHRHWSSRFAYILLCLVGGLGGCAYWRTPSSSFAARNVERECLGNFERLDHALERSGLRDGEAATPAGFPYLRVNRFLASYRTAFTEAATRHAWLLALSELDHAARLAELANLSGVHREPLPSAAELDDCRRRLTEHIATDPQLFDRLIKAASVRDEYRDWQRVLGLYPLISEFARAGIRRLHQANPVGTTPPPPPAAALTIVYRWHSPRPAAVPKLRSVPRDELGRPRLSAREASRLLAYHAPEWHIATASDDDRLGSPVWRGGRVAIDTAEPAMYHYLSHAKFDGEVLLQLNYVVWFPARQAEGGFDLLAGPIDGLTWRVTLDRDGMPLIYDIMHNCGCYHQFYPTARLIQRPSDPTEEALWVPRTLVPQSLAITLAPRSHYITAISTASGQGLTVTNRDYEVLRSLPFGERRRGIFGNDGILWGSQRAERFILWPLGVPAPGAMRSRGHHATAFVGRRHFDDPNLFDRYFERRRASDL